MASIILFLLASAVISVAAQQRQSSILPGSSLTPITNSSWLSNSGLYAFGFYKQDNGYAVGIFLAGIPQKTVVWTANRDNQPVSNNSTLLFTNNGNFVLRTTQSRNYDIGDPLQLASSASMLDSGNFVLYNSSGKIVWQSFDHPTDTLLPSQGLLAGQELISSDSETDHSTGIFRLKMQEDGNLVQYPVGSAPYSYYTSWTYNLGPGVMLNFNVDGHLYLLNATGFNIRNITSGRNSTKETIYRLRIDADGLFRLYSYNNETWSIEWSSSKDKCDPKGICGVNGFCVTSDVEANCVCLPGFKFVNKGNKTAGCEKVFIVDRCGNNHRFSNTTQELHNTIYSMQELRNTTWEYFPYSFVSVLEKKYCELACLEDCDCEAAIFLQDGICGKHKLPLRYGRQLVPDSSITLIKVAEAATTENSSDGFVPEKGNEKLRMDVLIIGISLAVSGLTMLAISVILLRRRYTSAFQRISANGEAEFSCEDLGPRSYSYSELERMTGGFEEEIGRGSSGTVYKGVNLKNVQKLVAVKRLEKVLCDGEREFQNEMKVIGKTHHRNLVRLVGFCLDGPGRLLVYDYMSNGSLADVLFAPENKTSWDKRMKIARDIARGIHYLHEECVDQIIHCDIKPQNILMDEKGCAKLSDFGLVKLLQSDQSKTFTGIRGTRGYVAPEWHLQKPVTAKADVYSFGIVMLEIICCRRGVNWNLPEEEAVLDEWVYHCFENGELGKLIGDHEEIDMQQFERMIKVGLWCIQYEPSLRPSIKMVLHMMEGLVDVPIPPNILNSCVYVDGAYPL